MRRSSPSSRSTAAGGEIVYCVEVESALAAHPAVYEAAVIGVPDEMMGEKVGAVIVVRPGAKPDVGEIMAFARERLADFKVPQYLAMRQEPLARNPGGKVLKAPLRRSVDWGEAGGVGPIAAELGPPDRFDADAAPASVWPWCPR